MFKIPFLRIFKETTKNYVNDKNLRHELNCNRWVFSERYYMIEHEQKDWEKYYLPFDITNKTILDVGSGEGETAFFFFKHGAKKVICIEPNKELFELLIINSCWHNIEAYSRKFNLSDLFTFNYDLAKLDIEGYEEILLTRTPQKPIILEVHGLQLRDKFLEKGYVQLTPQNNFTCNHYLYWSGN